MTPTRLLWTGPYAADLLGRAIERAGDDPGRLWIVPTRLARDEVAGALIRRRSGGERPAVFAWDDLWAEVARRHRRAPAILPDAASRAARVLAIERSRRAGELGPIGPVADLPGFRRGLKARFEAWTRGERDPAGPPPGDDDIGAAEWAIYGRYQAVLNQDGVKDRAGLAVWASRALDDGPIGRPSAVTIVDPVAPTRAQLRAIDWASRAAGSVLVLMRTPADPDDMAVAPLFLRLEEAEFVGVEFEPEEPTGLALLEASLFDDPTDDGGLGPIEGLSILGGPSGEGLGLILAREVRRRLEAGSRPDDLVVLVRRWDEDAERAREVLGSWGIPASGGRARPLASLPAVSALLSAMLVPIEGWEVTPVVRLLRNGQLDPADRAWSGPSRRAEAASVLNGLRVFRDRRAIERALDRRADDPAGSDRARRARAVFDRLADAIRLPTGVAPWPDRVEQLRTMADALGLGGLGPLWEALDDHAIVREPDAGPIDLAGFARSVEAIAAESDGPEPATRPGTVRFVAVDEAIGMRPRVAFLLNLGEGTFPVREAVAGAPEPEAEGGIPLAYSVERLRFLRVLGSARDEVVLLVPTADPKGNELLAAGFVEDVRRRLGDVRGAAGFDEIRLLDPTFRDHPALAGSPADRRVLAVARACLDREPGGLEILARDPSHRAALEGTAAGLRMLHDRLRSGRYTGFDGLLTDPGLVARLAEAFGPDHAFSPSQIESFATCPFQFYQKYVLKLAPVDDRPELREDFAGRGDRLHKLLEEIHAAIATEGDDVDVLDRLEAYIAERLRADTDLDDDFLGEVASGLLAIDRERSRRNLLEYRAQYRDYRSRADGVRPRHFELRFGEDGAEGGWAGLELGEGEGRVRLRGVIDRVDLVGPEAGSGFRIIDYKTGHAPAAAEVTRDLRMLQLPLYALAVERFLYGGDVADCDFGYWSVRRDGGYKAIRLDKESPWPVFREQVVAEVVRLAARLRGGSYEVHPTKKDCQRFCDYKLVCRIGQARDVDKEPAPIAIGPGPG